VREMSPHVAQNDQRPGGSALDLRTTTWPGYAVSQRIRKRVEEIFGWMKTVGNFRSTRYRGVQRTTFAAYLVAMLSAENNRRANSPKVIHRGIDEHIRWLEKRLSGFDDQLSGLIHAISPAATATIQHGCC